MSANDTVNHLEEIEIEAFLEQMDSESGGATSGQRLIQSSSRPLPIPPAEDLSEGVPVQAVAGIIGNIEAQPR